LKNKPHKVKNGDTLWSISKSNGIRYWPNIYFAKENSRLMQKYNNPDIIHPGDTVYIPDLSSIAPMEKTPKVIYRNIPLFTQSENTCWRATGKMLYIRKNNGPNAETNFDRAIGPVYRKMQSGLNFSLWRDFYCYHLGMKEAVISGFNELHYIIATHGPVVVAIGEGQTMHSMVMAGYDLILGKWLVLDPAAGEHISFAPMMVTVGGQRKYSSSTPSSVAANYRTGPATWQNMRRWLWIFDTNIYQKVYFY
jgi:hypothetical protein